MPRRGRRRPPAPVNRPKGLGSLAPLPSGRWRAQWTERGARRSRTFGTEAEADAYLKGRHAPAAPTADLPLGAYARQWLLERAPSWRPNTRQLYALLLTLWAPFHDTPLGRLDPAALDRHTLALQTRHAPATVRAARRLLRAILAPLVGVLWPRPLLGRLQLRAAPRGRLPAWSEAEARLALRAVRGHRLEPMLVLGLSCGLRPGELAGLQWSHLAPDCSVIYLAEQQTDWGPGPLKDNEPRTIRLAPKIAAYLRKLRASQPPGTAHVVLNADGRGYRVASLEAAYRRWLKSVERLRYIKPHGLRHSFASIQLGRGVPLPVVAEVLGHASPAITARVYAHVLGGQAELAAKSIEEALFGAPAKPRRRLKRAT